MTKADLLDLERDVETARERFADSLARVRSPAAFDQFKEDLLSQAREMRDELIDRTREAAQDKISHLVAEVKERAAANPAAALAIGAGLLWRLVHRPPIASLLVGVGAISLFNTPSGQRGGNGGGAGMKSLPGREAVQRATEFAKDKAQEWGEQAKASVQETLAHLPNAATRAAGRASDLAEEFVGDSTVRDKYLLGTAALAIGAAMVIAYQKGDS
jgi:hypothetical protein